METRPVLEIAADAYADLRAHVMPRGARVEEAAFIFARSEDETLECVDWMPVSSDGFVHQSEHYIELTDETRAAAIKRAHDLGASLIEVHSHPFQREARFSRSDRLGFLEFVPHVLWRLKKRPYAAIVMAPRSYDALTWFSSVDEPVGLRIRIDGRVVVPTGATLVAWSNPAWGDIHD